MKKLFTPENYLTGFLTFASLFVLYFLFTTTDSWRYVLGFIGMIVTFSIFGYIVNKTIEKFSK
jgi:hypothetical protein